MLERRIEDRRWARWQVTAATAVLDVAVVWLLAAAAALAFKLTGSSWRSADGVDRHWLVASALVGAAYLWARRAAGIGFVYVARHPPAGGTRFPARPFESEADPGLSPVIQVHVSAARAAQQRLRDAIHVSGVPEYRIGREIDALMALIGRSAERAQRLHQALKDIPVARVEARIGEVGAFGEPAVLDALSGRLAVQRRMQMQLSRFHDEMERTVAGLDALRDTVLEDPEVPDRDWVIDQVHGLHDDLSSLATGMSYAV